MVRAMQMRRWRCGASKRAGEGRRRWVEAERRSARLDAVRVSGVGIGVLEERAERDMS